MASRNSILRGLVALALILVVNADAEIKMKKLSYKEFTPFRTGSQEVLILFQRGAFAPPEIEEAATALVEQIPSAWVDCDWSKAKKICKELEIETFPSLVFFADKNDDQDYYTIDINRKASEIVEDVRGRLSGKTVVHKKSAEVAPSDGSGKWPDAIKHVTAEEWPAFRQQNPKVLLYLHTSWCSACHHVRAHLLDMAPQLDGAMAIAAMDCKSDEGKAVSPNGAHPNERFCAKNDIGTFPTFIYFEGDAEFGVKFPGELTGGGTYAAWAKQQAFGPGYVPTWPGDNGEVQHLSASTIDEFRSKQQAAVIYLHQANCAPCNDAKPEFIAASKRLKSQVAFGAIECSGSKENTKFCEETEGINQFPAFKWYDTAEQKTGEKMNWLPIDAQEVFNFAEKRLAKNAAAGADSLTDEQLSKLRVKQLNAILKARGFECKGCSEKSEYVEMVKKTKGQKKEKKEPKYKKTWAQEKRDNTMKNLEENGWSADEVKDPQIVEPQKKVIHHLSDETYEQWRKDNPTSVGFFWASWCNACAEKKPAYAIGSVAMSNQDIKFFALECDLNPVTARKHNISRFPTVAYFNSSDSLGKNFTFELPADFKSTIKKLHSPAEQVKFENKIPEAWEDEDAQVDHVTDENWEHWRQTNPRAVVFFYAPWCGSCKKMKPEYAEASLRLAKHSKETGRELKMAAMDCTENILICNEFSVTEYPTAYFFRDAEDEDGKIMKLVQSAQGITKGLLKLIRPTDGTVTPFVNEKPEGWGDDNDSKDVVHLDEEHWLSWRKENPRFFAMMYAPWCGHCTRLKPAFADASAELVADKIPLVGVDCTVEVDICAKYDVKGYPTLKWFTSSDEFDEGETLPFTGQDKDGLVEAIRIKMEQANEQADTEQEDEMEEIDDEPSSQEDDE